MANGYSRSRSPVRAINSANPSWGNGAPAPRSWSEPLAPELPAAAPAGYPVAENHPLACPECRSLLRLSLTPWSGEMLPPQPQRMSPSTLQPAPEQEEDPDFEESIRRQAGPDRRSLGTERRGHDPGRKRTGAQVHHVRGHGPSLRRARDRRENGRRVAGEPPAI